MTLHNQLAAIEWSKIDVGALLKDIKTSKIDVPAQIKQALGNALAQAKSVGGVTPILGFLRSFGTKGVLLLAAVIAIGVGGKYLYSAVKDSEFGREIAETLQSRFSSKMRSDSLRTAVASTLPFYADGNIAERKTISDEAVDLELDGYHAVRETYEAFDRLRRHLGSVAAIEAMFQVIDVGLASEKKRREALAYLRSQGYR